MGWRGKKSDKPQPPYRTLVLIGCMNGLGNFCAAVGQVHTVGTSQALLQLVGIPFVLGLAWIFLQQRPSLIATICAVAIIGGTALSAVPHATADAGSLWYSVVLFFTAQVFFSGEKVYEEATFGKYVVLMKAVPHLVQRMCRFCRNFLNGVRLSRCYRQYSVCFVQKNGEFFVHACITCKLTPCKCFPFTTCTTHRYDVDVLWMFLWTLWTQVILGWVTWPVQVREPH